MTDSRSPHLVQRRGFLRGALAAAVFVPLSSSLASCAMGGGGDENSAGEGGGEKSDKNPFGVGADTPLEVVIFDGGFGDEYAKAHAKLYNTSFPDAEVKLTSTQKIQQTLQPRFVGGNPPDVVDNSGADQMDINALITDGVIADLSDLLDAPSMDDPAVKVRDALVPGVEVAGTYNGKLMALNYVYTVYGMWYNQKLFDDKGWTVPKTWDDFMSVGDKIKSSGMAPWTYAGKYPYYMAWPLVGLIFNAGGAETVEKLQTLAEDAWTADPVVKSAKAFQQVVDNGWVLSGTAGLDHVQSQQQWLDGKAAFIPCGSWIENEMKDSIPEGFEMAVAPMPSVGADDKSPYGSLYANAGEPFIVAAKGKNPAGGKEYLRAMLSKEGAQKFAEATNSLTALKDAPLPSSAGAGLKSVQSVVKAAGDNTTSLFYDVRYPKLWDDLGNALGQFMTGKIKADEFCEQMQKKTDDTRNDPNITKYD
ncbi:N-acetylglucosamine/diacetylchitobiose ABC transporter substrate-binding protein [Saxibacter everestensis]|uniref:N-acetylglucosamine/diacetylchitobiose ABC transporter substrate-binding protein n=1 Tax=Saxibacter everestensis TaxID=2909229 RepID=A0ABY8QVB0_9MICO|nr:N-acetylglucosamine/diacetylchitobiose ABC transporter substrate-binding protein [Brevibacteriaceae bacterium ZFBP1038]